MLRTDENLYHSWKRNIHTYAYTIKVKYTFSPIYSIENWTERNLISKTFESMRVIKNHCASFEFIGIILPFFIHL